MSSGKLHWGILGAAQIARKNWKAILDCGCGTLVGVASRDVERCRRFIAECQAEAPFAPAPRALASYDDLLASKEVEAVYIPLPTGVRKEWVLRAAAAGKHVLCEKPCAVTSADLLEMIEACQRHRVQFMDGVMFAHSQRLNAMRDVLDDGRTIGPIRRITSAFSFRAPPEFFAANIRAHSDLEPHGCLGDLGWYCIRFALWAMNWRMPKEVTGRLLASFVHDDIPARVPTEFSGELTFDDGVSSGFYCSFLSENQQWAMVSGTEAYLELPDFVLPYAGRELLFEVRKNVFQTQGCDFRMEARVQRFKVVEHSHGHPTAQEANMFRNFSEQVLSGRLEARWPEMALQTQQILEACRRSAGAGGEAVVPGNGLLRSR